MRQSRLLLGAVLIGGINPLLGQTVADAEPQWIYSDIRSDAEIATDRLGTYLIGNLAIGETEKNLVVEGGSRTAAARNLPLALQVDLVSDADGVIASYRSEYVDFPPERDRNLAAWFPRPEELNDALAAPLKPAEFVIFRIGQKTVINGLGRETVPRQCGPVTHALLVTMVSRQQEFSGSSGTGKTMALCLEH
jgi:hypothetical protein